MAGIFGALGIYDNERVMLNTYGQRVVYDAVNQVLSEHNAALQAAMSLFVEEVTSDYLIRYKLPGGGRLQRMTSQTRPGAVKATGEWDVAFPLEEFAAQVASNRVDYAYMTTIDLDRHLKTVQMQNVNTVRHEILKRLFTSTQVQFPDPLHGLLRVEGLANGDAVLYPPVIGSEVEATDAHYLESGYAAADISNANDPYVTMAAELTEHFGRPTGGTNLVTFINADETPETIALTAFVEVPDRYIRLGANTPEPIGLPATMPGRILGRHETAGTWVVEWPWIPSGYMVMVDIDAPPPLKMRVDPADTGLGYGLTLIADSDVYPFSASHYSNRFGFGCANRLNGVVMELAVGAGYTVPAVYQ